MDEEYKITIGIAIFMIAIVGAIYLFDAVGSDTEDRYTSTDAPRLVDMGEDYDFARYYSVFTPTEDGTYTLQKKVGTGPRIFFYAIDSKTGECVNDGLNGAKMEKGHTYQIWTDTHYSVDAYHFVIHTRV